MMDRETRDYWVEALRSGEFPQTQCVLRRPPPKATAGHGGRRKAGYCCLGVVAKINGVLTNHGTVEGSHFTLSAAARRAWGLSEHNLRQLIALNDRDQLPFDRIADWIEAQSMIDTLMCNNCGAVRETPDGNLSPCWEKFEGQDCLSTDVITLAEAVGGWLAWRSGIRTTFTPTPLVRPPISVEGDEGPACSIQHRDPGDEDDGSRK